MRLLLLAQRKSVAPVFQIAAMQAVSDAPPASGGVRAHPLVSQPAVFAEYSIARDIDSVRLPVFHRGMRHMPRYLRMSRTGSLVAYKRPLEMTVPLRLNFNPAVAPVVSQPFILHYRCRKSIYRHIPGFLVWYRHGGVEVINVKPKQFIKKREKSLYLQGM